MKQKPEHKNDPLDSLAAEWTDLFQTRQLLRQKKEEYVSWQDGEPGGYPPRRSRYGLRSADEDEAAAIESEYNTAINDLEARISALRLGIQQTIFIFDPYAVLGIPSSATGKEIHTAYTKKLEQYAGCIALWQEDLTKLNLRQFPIPGVQEGEEAWSEIYLSHNVEGCIWCLVQVQMAYDNGQSKIDTPDVK